ncbi:hypothetical protein KC19_1G103000 [Ceratodon purpureus]|uniref:Ubiquitin-like protease family profile domain-containing protein n=1 Tax=Ceratodon purpureus TaxID=3225 RepID=A0A8T0J3H7_CERPU|nr:hypothetical protein KC19_1G103000 [Ceratodon purpureus]
MKRFRTTRKKPSFSVKDLGGYVDGETLELEIIPEAKEQKKRKVLDDSDGGKVKLTVELHNSTTVHDKGGGDGGGGCSQELEEGRPGRRNHLPQTVVSDKQQNGRNVYHRGLGSLNSSHEQQHGLKSTSSAQNNFFERMSTCSTVKENTRSSETHKEINPRRVRSLSLRRLSSRNSVASMEEGGASHANSVKQSRADELGCCSKCNKRFPNLSRVSGSSDFLCSACRRRSKGVDPDVSLIIDFQTYAAKSPGSGRKQQTGKREKDIIGRTPDTAMEIESSDEEEAADNTGSVMNPCEQHLQSGLQNATNRMLGFRIAYPSRTDPQAVEILASDIQRLDPLEFLNDTIIDFYIKYIQSEFLSLEGGRRFHFFNSFFYKKLSGIVGKKSVWPAQKTKKVADLSQLRKWTRGINIFEKDYLFIPVHDKLHWSLAIICFPNHGPGSASGCERCILHLDSMTCGHDSSTVFRLIRSYLVEEGALMEGDDSIKTLTCSNIPAKKVPVPLQENESDCGLFLLHYIRKFVESAPKKLKMSDVENRLGDIGLFGRQWFFPIEASSLRTSIQEQLQRLFAENDGTLGVSSDASLETFVTGVPRKLEAEF